MNTQESPFNAQAEAAPPGENPAYAAPRTEEERLEDSARAVMHPDSHDTDWRYYFGAWGG